MKSLGELTGAAHASPEERLELISRCLLVTTCFKLLGLILVSEPKEKSNPVAGRDGEAETFGQSLSLELPNLG